MFDVIRYVLSGSYFVNNCFSQILNRCNIQLKAVCLVFILPDGIERSSV